jgi:RNA polymerase sigma factor (sigma-70 family)
LTSGNRLITASSRIGLRFAADDRLAAFIRRGDSSAFEVLYERHAGELLSFCVYMLGSRPDAEDAVQATFAAAYRSLRTRQRPAALRPWLFTIARNESLSILRKRHPTVELNGEPAPGGDPSRELELREEVRRMVEGLRELPERQRAALVLAELHGLSQGEIGAVLGVRAEQVKAYVYQARSHLISDRRAREADCREIREELAIARGPSLLRGRLRRHVHSCEGCRVYADGVARQRRQLGALLPWAPSLALKYRALEHALGGRGPDPAKFAGGATAGGSLAGAAAEFGSSGVKGLAVKMAAGVACLGACSGVGASVLATPSTPQGGSALVSNARPPSLRLSASAGSPSAVGWAQVDAARAGRREVAAPRLGVDKQNVQLPASSTQQRTAAVRHSGHRDRGVGSLYSIGAEGGDTRQPRQPATSKQERQRARMQRRGDVGVGPPEQSNPPGQGNPPEQSKEQRQREREGRQREREGHQRVGGAREPNENREQRQLERQERQRVGGPKRNREERRREREGR